MPPSTPPRELTAKVYQHFTPYVRRALSELGVPEADLADLSHEVFLIVHQKSEHLEEVAYFDLWLREICRRVAAGYRRRARHRLELLSSEPPLAEVELNDNDPAAQLEQEALVRHALAELDEESRELLALHDVGELPITELARLTLRDRKTVRKRLELARRRLATLMRSAEANGAGWRASATLPPRSPPPCTAGSLQPLQSLQLLTVTEDIAVALCGNVAITVWPGVASTEAFDVLSHWAPSVVAACGGQFCYLALVESTVRPPPLAARRKIVEMLDVFGPHLSKYATVLFGGGAWIAQPIMSGLMVLARPRFPMRFFKTMDAASEWLADVSRGPNGPLLPPELAAAAERLREITHAHVAKAQAG